MSLNGIDRSRTLRKYSPMFTPAFGKEPLGKFRSRPKTYNVGRNMNEFIRQLPAVKTRAFRVSIKQPPRKVRDRCPVKNGVSMGAVAKKIFIQFSFHSLLGIKLGCIFRR